MMDATSPTTTEKFWVKFGTSMTFREFFKLLEEPPRGQSLLVLSKRVRVTKTTTGRYVAFLIAQGLVQRERIGNVDLYALTNQGKTLKEELK